MDPISAEDAFAYLVTVGLPQSVAAIIELQGVAIDRGLRWLQEALGKLINEALDEINQTAVEMAAVADGWIIAKMIETHGRNRPFSGNMEQHVRSEVGPLGLVKVAMLDELDKIINPAGGYGPYWRAQEYGTGTSEVPSQSGRLLFGTFEPSGEPPDAAQRGLGQGQDLTFEPMGQAPGFGRISVELPGRHFLRDGATKAGESYIQRMTEIRDKYLVRLRELVEQVRLQRQTSVGRSVRMRIDS